MNQDVIECKKYVPLDKIKATSKVCIEDLIGNREFISRASAIGFTPGTNLLVLQNYRLGPLVVYLKNTQIALGRNEAKKIYVRELE